MRLNIELSKITPESGGSNVGEVVKDEYQTDYVAGQDNINPFGLDLHNWVFPVTAVVVVLFVIATLLFPAMAKGTLDGAKWGIIASFDWFFLLDRKSTRLNSSHVRISYAVFCLKKKR